MAFDFGAALTSTGNVTPALQQATENQRARARQDVLDKLKARELQEWVPVRSYSGADGSKHTIYLTPTGYQDKTDEPSFQDQAKSKLDALQQFYKDNKLQWTPEIAQSAADQIYGLKPTGVKTLPGKQGEPFKGADGKWYHKVLNSATGQIEDEWMGANYQGPAQTKPPALDWVDQYDAATKQWHKVGYDKSTHEKVAELPETKVGFGITPTETMTWNPTVGEWVPSYHMPSPSSSFGTDGQQAPPAASPFPKAPTGMGSFPSSAGPQKSSQSGSSSAPPPIAKYPSMGAQFRQTFDTIAALQQQFLGEGNDPLWKYAYMMDNKPLAAAINDALTASMQVIPTGSADPGLGQSISRATGLFGFVQNKVSENIRSSREKVQKLGGDEALQLVDRLAELKGSIPAMRTYSKASAAQGSIAPLIQESAVLNTSSARDFTLRIAYTMRTLAAAMANDPSINPAYSRWFYAQAAAAEQAGKTQKTAGAAPAKSPRTAKEYLNGVQ